MKKLLIFFFILIALLIAGYFTWNYFTNPTGDQKVVFTPAQSQHFTRGNLNYTVYLAENGVSDDVVYYLHGRNLDPSVWNDDTYFTLIRTQFLINSEKK